MLLEKKDRDCHDFKGVVAVSFSGGRVREKEGFFNSKSRSRERFDIISKMSNPAPQVILEGVNPGGSDAAGKENATAPIKPWQS